MNFRICINQIIFLTFLFPTLLQGQSFITTWNTTNPGLSSSTSIEIPTGAGVFDYDVDWDNDGVFDEVNINGSITHDFGADGIYTIRIQGDFPSILFNNGGDKDKIVDIAQWGNIQWKSFENAFLGCSNLNASATDSPVLTNVLNYSFAFQLANQFNGDVSNWDVSAAQNMRGMFWGANAFNGNVSNWNVTNVTDMSFMFFLASAFNKDLTNWDVGNVSLMSQMFSSANIFNGDVSTWNTASVIDMSFMFSGALAFDQDLGGWNIPLVTDMSSMLDNTAMTIENYDNTLIGWANQAINDNVNLGVLGLEYCGGESARFTLSNGHNWTISGDAKNCPYFIIQFDTSLPGTSNATSATIPSIGGNYAVDWDNDGLFDENNLSGNTTHDYGGAGIYTIMIKGDFPRIYFNNSGDRDKITSIIQWGDNPWTTMNSAFYGCNNLVIVAADNPNLSNVTDMSSMFRSASNFTGSLNNWDVSSITDMSNLFNGASNFSASISNWDVSSVQYMSGLFMNASSFNHSLSNWSISNVQDMTDMLSDCGMSTQNYDNTLIGWSVQNVQTNVDLGSQNLTYCEGENARNQLINQKIWNISGDSKACPFVTTWKTDNPGVSNSTSITIPTFQGETYSYDIDWENDGVFDDFGVGGDIAHDYGVSGIYEVAVRGQFPRIYFDNQGDKEKILSVDEWGNIEWSSMNAAFRGCLNIDISATDAPNLSNVTDLHGMFIGAAISNPDLTNWDVSTITDMSLLFLFCDDFVGDVSTWDVSNVTDMSGTFGWMDLFNGDLSAWDVSSVTNMSGMFSQSYDFNSPIGNWDVSNVTDMSQMFKWAHEFNQSIDSWDVSSVVDMEHMFDWANDFTQDLNSWDVSNVTNMQGMFVQTELFNGAIGNWDVSNVTDMRSMFAYSQAFNQDLSLWDVSSVTIMATMFNDSDVFNGNVSTWDVSNVTSMYFMFANNTVFNQDLNNWNISNVSNISSIFQDATAFNGEVGNWDVTGVTNLNNMFKGASSFNQDVSNWDVSNANQIGFLFNNATSFDQDISSWNVSNATYLGWMLSNSGMSTGNYDKLLIAWNGLNLQPNNGMGAQGLTYCKGESARLSMIINDGWSFSGDDKDCAFTTIWKTDNPGDSPNDAITIPTIGGGYNYDVDWNNDGVFDQFGINGSISHIYPQSGTYTIRIQGDFPRIYFNGSGDKEKLISIEQWGDNEWTSMENAFYGCINMVMTATDAPDLSNVTNLSSMFRDAELFNSNINNWDVSNVTNMYSMFWSNELFNQDLNNWDVSNVTDMSYMFWTAHAFNGDVSDWDVSSVTDMGRMFWWTDFNGDLSNWNVSNVTNMYEMFRASDSFNSDISGWDVSNVTDMTGMFSGNSLFNADLSDWDVSSVTSMQSMFRGAEVFNSNIGTWNVSNVTDMREIFRTATIFNQDIGNWNVSNVGDMGLMFSYAQAFNQDIGNWNVSNATIFQTMFKGAEAFNQDISNWDVSNVSNFTYTFSDAISFDQNLGEWDVTGAIDMTDMLNDCGMSQENYDQTLIGWAAQNVNQNVDLDADNLTYCIGENARNTLINTFGWVINGDSKSCPLAFTTTWKTDNPGTSNATSITIPAAGPGLKYHVDWNNDGVYDDLNITGSITHDYGVIGNYTVAITGALPRLSFNDSGDKEKILYINQWSDNAWTSMQNAFYGCNNLQITALDLPNLSNVESTGSMFRSASSLNSGLNGWDLSNVTSTTFMFADAISFNKNLDTWDVSNVDNMSYMFYNAAAFNGNISTWDVGEVTNMYGLFWNATSLNQNVGNWNTENVADMRKVFQSATAFNQDLGNWNIENVTQMNSMLSLSGLDLENYDNTLIAWANQNVKLNVSLGSEDLEYCASQESRDELINDHGWIISNDILGCAPCGVISWVGGMDNWMKPTLWDLNRLPLPCDDVEINQGGHVILLAGNNPSVLSLTNEGLLELKTGSKLEIISN
jgi:surface protein